MAQLRQDYDEFVKRDTEIVVIGPEDQAAFTDYWAEHNLPFVGCPDPDQAISSMYGQQVKLLKMGRLPAMMIIDKAGAIRYSHHGKSMRDIPDNADILSIIKRLNSEANAVSGKVNRN